MIDGDAIDGDASALTLCVEFPAYLARVYPVKEVSFWIHLHRDWHSA